MEKRLINKTKYTKGFYISLTLYKIKHSILSYVGGITICMTITQGIGLMRDNKVTGWWTVFAGAIIIPIIVYLIPYFINMRNYKKIVADNGGEDIDVSLELTDSKMICKNSMGQTQRLRYENIKDITEKSNLIIINFNVNAAPMYLSNKPEAFIGCTKEEMFDRLTKYSGVKIFK